MEYLTAIFNLPITQLLGVGFIIVILQRAGIDVMGTIKSLLKTNGKDSAKEIPEIIIEKLPILVNELPVIKEKLETITDNHLQHISDKLDKIIEINLEQLFILKEVAKRPNK